MKKTLFSQLAFENLQALKIVNQKLVFKVIELINDIQKHPFEGLGKPEPLKGDFSGYWSRRITDEHRLIYKVNNDMVEIYSCFGHY